MTISELYSLYLQCPTVTTDSRTCPPGSLFFALKGESFDGNTFAEKALLSGCEYAVVDDASIAKSDRMILVDDVLSTLQQLAYTHRKTLGIPVIGITGTNGKTTTKELTAAVLSQKYKTLYTLGNLNNHIGVPLTLLRLTNEHEIAVIEMGASHSGEISELANIASPDCGLITNVGYAHLEGFGSFEGIIRTKGELYDYLRRTKGFIFINQDNEYLTSIAGDLKKITYGEMASVENSVLANESYPFIGGKTSGSHPFFSFQWQQQNKAIQNIHTNLIGDYNLWNALAAITIGTHFGISPEQINKAIETYEPENLRSQLRITKHNELIIDAYNANPSSMRAALENFAAMKSFPKAVILGDMRELGESSPMLHADIIKQIESYDFDKVLLCGEHFSAAGQKYTCFPSVEKLNEYLETNPLQGYHILIKGSRGIHLEKTIDKL